jgi:hypothetical protein
MFKQAQFQLPKLYLCEQQDFHKSKITDNKLSHKINIYIICCNGIIKDVILMMVETVNYNLKTY